MTRDEAFAASRARVEAGAAQEEIIAFLRTEGFHKIDSIKVLRALYGLGLQDAKKAVHFSPAWDDVRAQDDAFHDELERVAMEWANEGNARVEAAARDRLRLRIVYGVMAILLFIAVLALAVRFWR